MADVKLAKIIQDKRKEIIPSTKDLIKETFRDLGYIRQERTLEKIIGITLEYALDNFNPILKRVFDHALVVLERYEDSLYINHVLPEICSLHSDVLKKIRNDDPVEFATIVVQKLYGDLWQMMLSRSQSRKTRGGKDWEYEIAYMLDLINVPYRMQSTRDRSDFKIPSEEAFKRDRTKTILLSAKRSLRERWRQVASELHETRAANVYLATTEESLPESKLDEIWEYNVHVLVWDETKSKYPTHPGVVSFSDFSKRDIPTFRKFW